MNFISEIDLRPLKEIIVPQDKALIPGLKNIGVNNNIREVRIGKQVILKAENKEEAENCVETACKKFIANLINREYLLKLKKF